MQCNVMVYREPRVLMWKKTCIYKFGMGKGKREPCENWLEWKALVGVQSF